ncbi:MAG: VOC family protein [Candidatus Dormibacteria bacterium]
MGYTFRAGGEPRGGDQHGVSGRDWLGLHEPVGTSRIAFQQVSSLKESTWPDGHVPAQLHLDLTVPDRQMLDLQHERARRLGARLLEDRSDDTGESLRVYADPSGHPSSQA